MYEGRGYCNVRTAHERKTCQLGTRCTGVRAETSLLLVVTVPHKTPFARTMYPLVHSVRGESQRTFPMKRENSSSTSRPCWIKFYPFPIQHTTKLTKSVLDHCNQIKPLDNKINPHTFYSIQNIKIPHVNIANAMEGVSKSADERSQNIVFISQVLFN